MEYTLNAVRVFVSDWDRAIRFCTETLAHFRDPDRNVLTLLGSRPRR